MQKPLSSTVLSNYEIYLNASTVRINVEDCLRLKKELSTIVERTEELHHLLESNDHEIYQVYCEYRRLRRFVDRVKLYIAKSDTNFHDDIVELLKTYTILVFDIGSVILRTILRNVQDTLILADDDPCTLIRSLQVAVTEDSSQYKVLTDLHFAATVTATATTATTTATTISTTTTTTNNNNNNNNTTDDINKIKTMKEYIIRTIEEFIGEQFLHLTLSPDELQR